MTDRSDDDSRTAAYAKLDKAFLDTPAEMVETVSLVAWLKTWEHRRDGMLTTDLLVELIPEVVGAIAGLERRIVALEAK